MAAEVLPAAFLCQRGVILLRNKSKCMFLLVGFMCKRCVVQVRKSLCRVCFSACLRVCGCSHCCVPVLCGQQEKH